MHTYMQHTCKGVHHNTVSYQRRAKIMHTCVQQHAYTRSCCNVTHIHTHIHMQTHHLHDLLETHTQKCTHKTIITRKHENHTHIQHTSNTHTNTYTHIHTYIHTYTTASHRPRILHSHTTPLLLPRTHTHTHTYIHTYIHAYTTASHRPRILHSHTTPPLLLRIQRILPGKFRRNYLAGNHRKNRNRNVT
jgi:hypothetical protein